jgi:hypothetical protein
MAHRLIRFSATDTQTYIVNVLLKRFFKPAGATTRGSLAAAPRRLLKLDKLPDAFTR